MQIPSRRRARPQVRRPLMVRVRPNDPVDTRTYPMRLDEARALALSGVAARAVRGTL